MSAKSIESEFTSSMAFSRVEASSTVYPALAKSRVRDDIRVGSLPNERMCSGAVIPMPPYERGTHQECARDNESWPKKCRVKMEPSLLDFIEKANLMSVRHQTVAISKFRLRRDRRRNCTRRDSGIMAVACSGLHPS